MEILRLFPGGIGSRDDLPYTARFEELFRRFRKLTGTGWSKSEFWHAVTFVAKKSRKPKPLFESAPAGGLPSEVIAFLETQNPWWLGQPARPTPVFKRWGFDEVLSRFREPTAKVVALRGPRQVGKSTIQDQFIERLLLLDGVRPDRIFRVQFDEVPALGRFEMPILALVNWFTRNVARKSLNEAAREGEPVHLFFDEIQNLTQWSEQLKSLVDHAEVRTLITGSSALRIGKSRDSLAGRLAEIELGPMRLWEIARVRGLKLDPFSHPDRTGDWVRKEFWLELIEHARKAGEPLNEAFRFFSELGGYPVCHQAASSKVQLADQLRDIVIHRTLNHERIPGVGDDVVREVFRVVCRHAGSRVTLKRIAQELNALSAEPIKEAQIQKVIGFLDEAMLIRLLPPLELLRRKMVQPPTICLCDHFLRYSLLREDVSLVPEDLRRAPSRATEAGHLMEGIIGNLFASTQGVDAFCFPERSPQEPEIDLVLTIGSRRIPVEVKYRSKVDREDCLGLRSFLDRSLYDAEFGIIVTRDQAGEIEENIIAVPASAMLLLM